MKYKKKPLKKNYKSNSSSKNAVQETISLRSCRQRSVLIPTVFLDNNDKTY